MILGLDISTTILGVCVLDYNGISKYSEFINLFSAKKEKTTDFKKKKKKIPKKNYMELFLRANKVKEYFRNLKERLGDEKIDKIVVEASLNSFLYGRTSMNTIIKLTRFNALVSYIALEVFDCELKFTEARTARKILGIVRNEEKGPKHEVIKYFENCGFVIKRTVSGNICKGYADMADAFVLAMSYLKSLN